MSDIYIYETSSNIKSVDPVKSEKVNGMQAHQKFQVYNISRRSR